MQRHKKGADDGSYMLVVFHVVVGGKGGITLGLAGALAQAEFFDLNYYFTLLLFTFITYHFFTD